MTVPMEFGEIDHKCINNIRVMAAEMVSKAKSGHPGAPMGLAPLAHVLFTRFLRHSSKNSQWMGRDRFVLSNGHACALQYVMLHLLGYNVSEDDLKGFRQVGSRLAGHPESHLLEGIEVTTGPLGQGVSNGVGLAIAEAHMAATFNKDEDQDCGNIIDNFTYVILGDGCMMEGIASEACSLAGHLKLGKLIMFYDDNAISIDGGTDLAFTEDVIKRFEAYGFHCQSLVDGDNDLEGIAKAISCAQAVKDRPSLIKIRTTIGYGSSLQGTEKVHGAPLSEDDIKKLKEHFHLSDLSPISTLEEVKQFYKNVKDRNEAICNEWNDRLRVYSEKYPEETDELMRRLAKKLPDNLKDILPHYNQADPAIATRKASENVLNAICPHIPEIIGGSADLTHSNLTKWKNSVDFQANDSKIGNNSGRYLRFGVREHGMFGICNGISAYGGLIPFASTFLNFISYGLGSVRLAALSRQQVIYIMTHDSIGLGEDGPTHQPIETLAGLRALPNITVIRPADGNEVSGAYMIALQNRSSPTVICLSRQNLPHLKGSSVEGVERGAYIVHDSSDSGKPDLILIGTGSEVAICMESASIIEKKNFNVRVVSMPSWELFERQDLENQSSVLLPNIPTISVEALSRLGWNRYAHYAVGMTDFGVSGPYQQVYDKFGFTGEKVASKAMAVLDFYQQNPLPNLRSLPQ